MHIRQVAEPRWSSSHDMVNRPYMCSSVDEVQRDPTFAHSTQRLNPQPVEIYVPAFFSITNKGQVRRSELTPTHGGEAETIWGCCCKIRK